MTLVARPAVVGLVLLLCLGLGLSGCSGDDGPPGSTESSAPPLPSGEAEKFQIETVTTWGEVVGRLDKDRRRRAEQAVTRVVQGWFNAAYVGGEYPRSSFRDAFPGFTPGARERARRDRFLLTNQRIGRQITGVTPTASRIRLDALAAGRRPVAITARFALGFRTKGDVARRVRVSGRLLLTRKPAGWRIFAYDVTKGGRPA